MKNRKSQILKGLTTVSFFATDHEKAVKWYSDFLETEPYFNVPGYSEFRLGDYEHELGIIDSKYAPTDYSTKPSGAVMYWHVDDLKATLEKINFYGG